jgi:hypothetical protein
MKNQSLSEIASAAGVARYKAQLDSSYKGEKKTELDRAEANAWAAIRKAHFDSMGYYAGPSEAQQLGFTAL